MAGLRTDKERLDTMDQVFTALDFDKPGQAAVPAKADFYLPFIDKALANGWMRDIPASLLRVLGQPDTHSQGPDNAWRFNATIVDTLLKQKPTKTEEGKTVQGMLGMGFCDIETKQCQNLPVTMEDTFVARGVHPMTHNNNAARVLPLDRSAAFILGASFAALNADEARKRQPLKAADSLLKGKVCMTNDSKDDDVVLCTRAGLGYGLSHPATAHGIAAKTNGAVPR